MVPKWTRARRSKVRLARRHESLGGQRMADVSHLPLYGWAAFVPGGTKRLQDCQSSRSYRILRVARVSTLKLRRKQSGSNLIFRRIGEQQSLRMLLASIGHDSWQSRTSIGVLKGEADALYSGQHQSPS